MSVHVRFKNVSIYTGSRNEMVFTHDSLGFINRTAAECHSPVAVSGSDGNAFAGKSIETVTSNTLSEKYPTLVGYFLCRSPSCNYRTNVL